MKILTGLFLFVSGVAFAAPEGVVEALEGQCSSVKTQIISEITQEDCTSPVGFCTKGKTVGFNLKGTTYYTTLAMGPTAADPQMQTSLSYTGNLVIKTRRGDLTITDLGVVDNAGKTFSETSRSLSGTGIFEKVSGNLFVYGAVTEKGFDGVIRGRICLNRGDSGAGHLN